MNNSFFELMNMLNHKYPLYKMIMAFGISLFWQLSAVAEEPEIQVDEQYEDSRTLSDRISFSAFLNAEWAYGYSENRHQKMEVYLEPEVEIDLFSDIRLTGIARLRGDGYDRLEPGKPDQDEIWKPSRRLIIGDHTDIELRELYLEIPFGDNYLTLGKQQIVWGKADGLKVLDVVNPQDFREFILDDFDDSRIPLWTMNLEVPISAVLLQLLWIPDRTYHNTPDSGAVYEFTAPFIVPVAPPGVLVDLQDVERPDRFFADSDVGIRLTTFWKGWDLSANYFYHFDDRPVLFQSLSITPTGPFVTIEPRYQRSHMIGGTFSNVFGDLTLRGELGYFTDRYFITNSPTDADGVFASDELSYVLGFDWFGFEDSLVSFQFFQSWVTDDESGIVRNELDTTTTLLLRHDFMNETLVTEILWLQNINNGDGMVRPKLSYEINDSVNVWAGLDIFYGDREGLFGQFQNNDRFIVGFEWGL